MDEYVDRLTKWISDEADNASRAEHGAVLSGDFPNASKMAVRIETLESVAAEARRLQRRMREDG